MESDDGSEILNQLFTNLRSNSNKFKKRYFRKTSVDAVFAERFSRTTRDLHEKPGFEKRDDIGLKCYPRQRNELLRERVLLPNYSNRNFFGKERRICLLKCLLDIRKKIRPKYKIHDHFRGGVDVRRTFPKGDTQNGQTIYIKLQILSVTQDRVVV